MQLHADGIVDQLPRYGWFVRVFDRNELTELYEIRELLECHAVGRVAENASASQIEELHSLVDELRAVARDLKRDETLAINPAHQKRTTSLDLAFHERILLMGGNRWVTKIAVNCRLISRLHGAKWQASLLACSSSERTAQQEQAAIAVLRHATFRTLWQHYQIWRAIRDKNVTLAQSIMARHIRAGLSNSLQYVGPVSADQQMASHLVAALRSPKN